MIRFEDTCLQDGSDQTTNVQSAIETAKASPDKILDITGLYCVRQAVFSNLNGLRVIGRGGLIGVSSSPIASVVSIHNAVNATFDCDWSPNAAGSTNYGCAIQVYADPGQSVSYLSFIGVKPTKAALGWKIGDDSAPDAQVSEIDIVNTTTCACASGLLAIGTQTVVDINGGSLESSTVGMPASFLSLPQLTLVSRGATVTRRGGQTMHVGLSTGGAANDSAWNTLLRVDAIASATYGNIIGNINLNGGVVETATYLATTTNQSPPLSNTVQGAINIQGVRGVCTASPGMYFCATDGTYTGRLMVRNCDFFSTNPRTMGTIVVGNSAARVLVDAASFGAGFMQGAGAYVGGTQTIN